MDPFPEGDGIEDSSETQPPIRAAREPGGADATSDGRQIHVIPDHRWPETDQPANLLPLTDSVTELSEAVAELKAQLGHLIQVNAALESDLDAARQQASDGIRERESLVERIEGYEGVLMVAEQTRAKLEQAGHERDILAAKVTDLSRSLASSEQRVHELEQLLAEYWTERNSATQEAACLESQFARAVKVIEELRLALSASEEREQQYRLSIRVFKEKMEEAVVERDSVKAELIEAREALECIRQSILAASREAHEGTFQD